MASSYAPRFGVTRRRDKHGCLSNSVTQILRPTRLRKMATARQARPPPAHPHSSNRGGRHRKKWGASKFGNYRSRLARSTRLHPNAAAALERSIFISSIVEKILERLEQERAEAGGSLRAAAPALRTKPRECVGLLPGAEASGPEPAGRVALAKEARDVALQTIGRGCTDSRSHLLRSIAFAPILGSAARRSAF